jgi:hypothetical protein
LPYNRSIVLHRFLSVLFVILGIGLALETWTIERYQTRLRAGALRTTGTVAHVLEAKRDNGSVRHIPVIRFTTASGDHVDFTAVAASSASYGVGAAVPLYYHPDNPSFAGLDDFKSRWSGTALAAAMSLFSFLIALALFRALRRQPA